MPDKIELIDVSLSYGATVVLDNVNMTIGKGDVIVIGGRSGQGKSSLLELCAGLVRPNSGKVVWDGRDIVELTKGEMLAARRQSLGYLFQIHALISNFTTFNNIALPLRSRAGITEAQITEKVKASMEQLGLFETDNKYPEALSVYECKAAALARALIAEPSMLILDEPLSAINPEEAGTLLGYIERHYRERTMAIVMTSHTFSLWPEVPVQRMILSKGTLAPFSGELPGAGNVDNKE
jgi:ABC-type transporter Mla maintaining outer membrane lipid asymmetry ATPase subunit MlaF